LICNVAQRDDTTNEEQHLMGKSEQGKGGGARKIGRNKKKCEKYRFSKATGASIDGNKKPKGIGNRSTAPRRVNAWEQGRIIDLHMMNEDRVPVFRPLFECPHLATELLESSRLLGLNRSPGTFKENAAELSRHVKSTMRHQVMFFPERPKVETVVRKVL
jgi:hypothetical protein